MQCSKNLKNFTTRSFWKKHILFVSVCLFIYIHRRMETVRVGVSRLSQLRKVFVLKTTYLCPVVPTVINSYETDTSLSIASTGEKRKEISASFSKGEISPFASLPQQQLLPFWTRGLVTCYLEVVYPIYVYTCVQYQPRMLHANQSEIFDEKSI